VSVTNAVHLFFFPQISYSKCVALSAGNYSIHCKKSWRSSSTPASGDAGPNDTGVEQIFPHPCRKFYYKYRTFPAFFTNVELVRQSRKVSKAACGGAGANLRPTGLQSATLPLRPAFNSYHNNTWCTVKWGNIVFGINIVTSLAKFLTGHNSRTNEFISLT